VYLFNIYHFTFYFHKNLKSYFSVSFNSLFCCFTGGLPGNFLFRNHRIVADIPLLPGHPIEAHLIRIRPARNHLFSSSSSSSSGSSSSEDDNDDNDASGPEDGHGGDGGIGDSDSDDSVVVVYDSRARRGQGDGAALLQLQNVTGVLSDALDCLPPGLDADDISLETLHRISR